MRIQSGVLVAGAFVLAMMGQQGSRQPAPIVVDYPLEG
jgi:hypothetical protein